MLKRCCNRNQRDEEDRMIRSSEAHAQKEQMKRDSIERNTKILREDLY